MKKKFYILILLTLSFLAVNIYSQTGNNVLLEFCTGTWCQWCPCGDYTAEALLQNYPNTMVLAYHGGGGGDPYQVFNGNSIITLLGFTGYPEASIGRRIGQLTYNAWNNPVVIQSLSRYPGVSIAFTKTYNSSTRQLMLTANCTSMREIDTACNICLVITEDGLIYNQVNNGVCIGGGANWVHKWVVRNMVDGATGDVLSTGSWAANTLKTKSWTVTLDNSWIDANCNANVFVYFVSGNLADQSYVQQTKVQSVTLPVGVNNNNKPVPANYILDQNYPNPFNPTTNIKFSIPKDGFVSLKIYNITGAVIQTYVDGYIKAGNYNAEVDASNLSSGVYFYTLKTADFLQTKKMMLVK